MESYLRMRRSERIADRFLKARDAKGFRAAWREVMRDSKAFEFEPVRSRDDVVLKLGQAAVCLKDGAETEHLVVLLESFAVPSPINSAWLTALRVRLGIIEEDAPHVTYVANLLRSILAGAEQSKLA